MQLSTALQILVVLVLLACFLLQVWDATLKFFAGQTTLAATTERLVNGGLLPAVSLCPGFRDEERDYFEQYGDLHEILEGSPGKKPATVKHQHIFTSGI